MQFQQHARQLLAGDVKQRGIGKNAVEPVVGKVERKEVLLPDFQTLAARHRDELRRTFQPNRGVTEFGEGLEIPTRSAAQVEDGSGRSRLDATEQRRNVLADVVGLCAGPESLGAVAVMLQGAGGELGQVVSSQTHHHDCDSVASNATWQARPVCAAAAPMAASLNVADSVHAAFRTRQ